MPASQPASRFASLADRLAEPLQAVSPISARKSAWASRLAGVGRCAGRHCGVPIGQRPFSFFFIFENLYKRDFNFIFICTTCFNEFSLSLNFCTRASSSDGSQQRVQSNDEWISDSHGTRGIWMGPDERADGPRV